MEKKCSIKIRYAMGVEKQLYIYEDKFGTGIVKEEIIEDEIA